MNIPIVAGDIVDDGGFNRPRFVRVSWYVYYYAVFLPNFTVSWFWISKAIARLWTPQGWSLNFAFYGAKLIRRGNSADVMTHGACLYIFIDLPDDRCQRPVFHFHFRFYVTMHSGSHLPLNATVCYWNQFCLRFLNTSYLAIIIFDI